MAYKPNQRTKGGVAKRAQRRLKALGDVRGVDPKQGISGREARKIRAAYQQKNKPAGKPKTSGLATRTRFREQATGTLPGVNTQNGVTRREARRVKRAWVRGGRQQPFNPLTPLAGKAYADEARAAEELEFGDQRRAYDRDIRQSGQQRVDTGGYYDEYKTALQESAQRVKQAGDAAVAGAGARVDLAAQQDTASLAARDAAASAQAANLGRGPVASTEGAQATANQRALGNAAVATTAGVNQADYALMEKNAANATLAKLQALRDEDTRRQGLVEKRRDLEKTVGAFRTDYRSKARDQERTYAAVQQEFGLKAKGSDSQVKVAKTYSRAKVKTAYIQALQAKEYSKAKKFGARLGLRQAKIQSDAKRYAADQNARNSGGGGGGGGSSGGGSGGSSGGSRHTPSDRRDDKARFRSLVRYAEQRTTPPGAVDPLMKNAVEEHVRNGRKGVSRATARKMKRAYGISLPIYRAPSPTTPRSRNAPGGQTTNTNSRGGNTSRPT